MYPEKKCSICGTMFKPRQYNHVVCSVECRKRYKADYAAKLAESGYFTKWQRDNKDTINTNKVARHSAKIGRVDGKLPPKTCPECGETFVPKHVHKRFCTHKCNSKYMWKHPEEKGTNKRRILESKIRAV